MTAKTGTYSFDFEREAKALRKDLGTRADNLLFASVRVAKRDEDGVSPEISFLQIIAGKKVRGAHVPKSLNWPIDRFTENPDKSSAYRENPDSKGFGFSTVRGVICLKEHEHMTNIFGKGNEPLLTLFTLYHETAHALINGPKVDNDHPVQESAADAYAALRLLQRFGEEAVPLLSMFSWYRSYSTLLYQETSHFSTTVLDKIIADSRHRNFSKLSPAKAITLAEAYAQEWTPKAQELSAARAVFARAGDETTAKLMDLLSTTCLSSPDSNLAFYTGAKVLEGLSKPEGCSLFGKDYEFTTETDRAWAAAVKARISNKGMREFFNVSAKRKKRSQTPRRDASLAEAVKVSIPRDQKKFIYQSVY